VLASIATEVHQITPDQCYMQKLPPEFSCSLTGSPSARGMSNHFPINATHKNFHLYSCRIALKRYIESTPNQHYMQKLPPESNSSTASPSACQHYYRGILNHSQSTLYAKTSTWILHRIAQCLPALASITQWLSQQARPSLSVCSPFPQILILTRSPSKIQTSST
jgi:hypothetical protein